MEKLSFNFDAVISIQKGEINKNKVKNNLEKLNKSNFEEIEFKGDKELQITDFNLMSNIFNVNKYENVSHVKLKDISATLSFLLDYELSKNRKIEEMKNNINISLQALREKFKERFGRNMEMKFKNRKKQSKVVIWDSNEFLGLRLDLDHGLGEEEINVRLEWLYEGEIDKSVLKRIDNSVIKKSKEVLNHFNPKEEEIGLPETIDEKTRANYVFIVSLMDYQSISTSEALRLAMKEALEHFPFLFNPNSKEWDRLFSMDEEKRQKILAPIIMGFIGGMFRRKRSSTIKNWVDMVSFLRKACEGDAGKFFKVACEKLGVDPTESDALEKVQKMLSNRMVREKIGINFPIGKKTGRVMFTMMTDNKRGHGVMEGVNRKQMKNFHLGVDVQVLRVALNTGLLKIKRINKDSSLIEKIKPNKLDVGSSRTFMHLKRRDFTEICQRAWKSAADKLGMMVINLDEYIFRIGSFLCKDRGSMCYICPFNEFCTSWKRGRVFEAGGKHPSNGCFTYSQTGDLENALWIRTCNMCEDNHTINQKGEKEENRDKVINECKKGNRVVKSKPKTRLFPF